MDIYGTLGPACSDEETLLGMLRAGMTGARLNLSHVGLAESEPILFAYRRAAACAGIGAKLLVDIQGAELRIGKLGAPVHLEAGARVTLGDGGIPIPEEVLSALKTGIRIVLDDSQVLLEARRCEERFAACEVLRSGTISSRKSIALEGAAVAMPALTGHDRENLSLAAQYGVTGVLLPFCTGPDDVSALRGMLAALAAPALHIMAKIENRAGVDAVEAICAEADEICIARGDLGNAIPLWTLPAVQKQIAAICNRKARPFCVATQLLHSMTTSAVPTRAELNDIFNTVLDGAASVILTGETAVGKHPVEAIRYLSRTIDEARRFFRK